MSTNPLHQFDSYSYHIKLVIPPIDMVKEPGMGIPDGVGITVAETGKSAQFFIDGLEMSTIAPSGSTAITTAVTEARLTITEQNGFCFFEKLFASIGEMGWENPLEAVFFLEISFNGWKQDGSPAPQIFKRGWRSKLTNIDVQFDISQPKYEMVIMPENQIAFEESNLKTNRMFKSEIKETYTETLAEFQTKMNESLKNFEGSVNTPVGAQDEYIFQIGPKFKELVPEDIMEIIDENNASSFMKSPDGTYEYVYSGCTRIDESLMRLAANIRDIGKVLLQNVQSDNTLDTGMIPSTELAKFFSVTATTAIGEFNPNRNNYAKTYTYTIDIVNRPDMDVQPPNASGDIGRAMSYESQGIFIREYPYTFTGKNVDVLSANMDFNGMFAHIANAYQRPSYQQSHSVDAAGETYENDTDEVLARKKSYGFSQTLPNLLSPIAALLSSGSLMEEKGGSFNMASLFNYQNKARSNPESTRSGVATANNPQHESHTKIIDEAFARALYCPAQYLVSLDLTILGDPIWLDNGDSVGYGPVTNFSGGTKMLRFIMKTGEPYSDSTGLPFKMGNVTFSGYYNVTHLTSTFKNGQFTQRLNCVYDTTTADTVF